MSPVRFWAGFAILAVWLFGLLAYAVWLLVTGQPGMTLGIVAAVWVSGKTLPRPVSWLMSLGSDAP